MKTKMKLMAAFKIWIVIYPSVTLFLYLLGKPLSALPLYQQTFSLTVLLVPWMVFAGIPFVDAAIKIMANKINKPKQYIKNDNAEKF